MKLGRWIIENDFSTKWRVPNRNAVFAVVGEQVCDKQVLYLEFGVYKGTSIRYWSNMLKHPEAKLHGFDSFVGLPDDFDIGVGPLTKGSYDVNGTAPEVQDPRVRFFKGWFNEVLPTYQLPEHEVLVIMMDADLYSSTIYVLRHLRPFIKPGTFIYFDDLNHRDHDPRAFVEFIKESGLRFRLVCAEHAYSTAFFECVK